MTGQELRLSQIFRNNQNAFLLPLDHGVTIGPVSGLTDIRSLVDSVKDSINGVIVHKGLIPMVSDSISPNGCQLIVHLSASTSLSPDPNKKLLVTSVEHAVRRGATAVSIHVNLGSQSEVDMLKDLGVTADQCEEWGIPLIAMMYVRDGSKKSEFDCEKIRHAARVAEELGASIVKVNYTGTPDTFSKVVDSVKIPVVIAGGPKMSSDRELLTMIRDAVRAGARGVAVGRNLFQHGKSDALAGIIRQILDSPVSDDIIDVLLNDLA